jgi:glycosyltransferase involved in cell wall biosynthesis
MLSNVSDDDLTLLYSRCLFTFYPSYYEGWGFPVIESLCYGKVPLLSTAPSLREAGGRFANYFELGSDSAMISAVERLAFDKEHRLARERYIKDHFRPRAWTDVGAQIEEVATQAWKRAALGADSAPA